MTNKDKLKTLLLDVFLLEDDEFNFELKRNEIETWDSLGVVSMAVGVQETFGHHMSPEQAVEVASVPDIIQFLSRNGVAFDEG